MKAVLDDKEGADTQVYSSYETFLLNFVAAVIFHKVFENKTAAYVKLARGGCFY